MNALIDMPFPVFAMLYVASLVIIPIILWQYYLQQWKYPRWQEATRHAHRFPMRIERLIRFRWIHYDCRYWIFPVRFDQGPLRVRGRANEALYWSLTYYAWTESNPSVSSETITLSNNNNYDILLAKDASGTDSIRVRTNARYGVLYLRIYEPLHSHPVHLPAVIQNGVKLSEAFEA